MRYIFQTGNGTDERNKKENTPEVGRFFKNPDTNKCCSDGTDARPDSIGCADGDVLNGLDQQPHAQHEGDGECSVPEVHFISCGRLGFLQAGGECYFEEAGDDEDDPIHRFNIFPADLADLAD